MLAIALTHFVDMLVMFLSFQSRADAGQFVPFNGRAAGIMAVDRVDEQQGVAVVVLQDVGHATHLGRHTGHVTTIVDLATGAVLSVKTTLKAPNGDTVCATEAAVGAPDPFTILLRGTITGGTGRFAGARGHYDSIVRGDKPLTPDNVALGVRVESVWLGKISSPGSSD